MIIKCKIDGEGFELHFSEAREIFVLNADDPKLNSTYLSWTHALCGQEYRILKNPPIVIKGDKDPIIIKDPPILTTSAVAEPIADEPNIIP